jgi:hypothetical protein
MKCTHRYPEKVGTVRWIGKGPNDVTRFEEKSEWRRCSWYDLDVVVLLNNNASAFNPQDRDEELTIFRDWLKENEYRELGIAKYPESTDAMLIKAGRDHEQFLADTMLEITLEVLRH